MTSRLSEESIATGILACRERFRRLWEAAADEQRARIVIDVPGRSERAAVVVGGLGQNLDDYLSNGLKVTPPGGTLTVRVVAGTDRHEVHAIYEGPGSAPCHVVDAPGRMAADSRGTVYLISPCCDR